MRAITWDIRQTKTDEEFRLYPIGDTHLGARLSDEIALKATVNNIKDDPNARWIGMGDYTDSIGRNVGDKRSAESGLAPWLLGEMKIYERQRDRFKEFFTPIADKCIGMLTGNHETAALRHQGVDMYYALAEHIQNAAGHSVPLALGYLGFVKLRFRYLSDNSKVRETRNGGMSSAPFTIVAHHGWGGGRKAGAKALKLEDMTRMYDADIYLMGHVHFELPLKGNRIAMNQSGKLIEKRWVSLMTGTYLRGHSLNDEYPTYAEEAGYPPTTIGSPVITIMPTTGKLSVLS